MVHLKKFKTYYWPLSKLWVIIENADSEKDNNAPVVQMDTVLELLEKTVVLIGQWSNILTYETFKNALLRAEEHPPYRLLQC